MTVDKKTLEKLGQHWAVEALGPERCQRADLVSMARLVRGAVASQLVLDFKDVSDDPQLVERAAAAYEIAAVEGLNALLHPVGDKNSEDLAKQAEAGAYRAFELLRTLKVPADDHQRIFHVLHLAALAYCGDRWTDLRRWLRERPSGEVDAPSAADAGWEDRVLFRLYDCWLRLFRKKSWDDLDGIRSIVAGLREDQKQHEAQALAEAAEAPAKVLAVRLISLYHWAKATELLAVYCLQGDPPAVSGQLDQHFEAAASAASIADDASLEVLLRWLHVAARRMVAGSLWWVARAVNSRVTKFVDSATKSQALFELLPPQRAALQEQGLLDQASRAIVVELPTSGGKTTLAQFRILQALNQFDADKGWVAYVAPTRALVSQITRRLRRDFSPIGVQVEQLTGAVEVDSFEEALLQETKDGPGFHVLVATPEKLQFVIRTKRVTRPLALLVLDEAHNIEDEDRGLRIELLLATVKRDCPTANFLLLMPYVPNAAALAKWLSPEAGKTISLGSSVWQPNERLLGLYDVQKEDGKKGNWSLWYETLTTTPKTMHLGGRHRVGSERPLKKPLSSMQSAIASTAAMAKVFSARGTSIAVGQTIPDAWSMARTLAESVDPFPSVPEDVRLVQRFLQAEISPNFELVDMLEKGIAVHHAGLSDEARGLVEWLTECGHLRVLCATTTIAQGINFPVSSVFLANRHLKMRAHPFQREMSTRDFWNLAGRAGRMQHDSVGVVGLAASKDPDGVKKFVSAATGDLVSRLLEMLDQLETSGGKLDLALVINQEQWADFRSYVAHLWAEKNNLDAVLAETEQLLRNTFGYTSLQGRSDPKSAERAKALLEGTRRYAQRLADHPENSVLADATGFSPEGVRSALLGLQGLERKLTTSDWEPTSLFGGGNTALPHLIGIMMRLPQVGSIEDLAGSSGADRKRIAAIATDWVGGVSIQQIATKYFSGTKTKPVDPTDAITNACRGIYRNLVNNGVWGLAALSKMPTSGIDFDALSDEDRRRINNAPAFLYHGVATEEAVLMRMNGVPRSISENIGSEFKESVGQVPGQPVQVARSFLRTLTDSDWDRLAPKGSPMTGSDYREVWMRLSGESD